MVRKYQAFLIALILALALDQGTKIWARHQLKPMHPSVVTVIPGYFELRYSENRGSAFSLIRHAGRAQWLFVVVGVIALIVIVSYLRKTAPGARRLPAELGILAGGALGNLIDRAAFGKVTDFVVWRIGTHEWPTFNVADALLVVGVIGLLFDLRPGQAPQKTRA